MTSVTEELRTLLDARGAEWTYADGTVSFNDGKHWFHAWAYNDGSLCVSMGYLTPAQAVEATLGRGTCEWQLVKKGPCYLVFRCSMCGYEHASSNTDACATELDPHYCPNCGREVVE